jgi:hypothetical protein
VKLAAAFVVLMVPGAFTLHAQEDSTGAIRHADVVVVGTLNHRFGFPWFDGWNERGDIAVDRVLKGTAQAGGSLSFAWERDFRQSWCLFRPDWRGAIGERGIWMLTRDGNRYRAPLLFGFAKLTNLPEILHALGDAK